MFVDPAVQEIVIVEPAHMSSLILYQLGHTVDAGDMALNLEAEGSIHVCMCCCFTDIKQITRVANCLFVFLYCFYIVPHIFCVFVFVFNFYFRHPMEPSMHRITRI